MRFSPAAFANAALVLGAALTFVSGLAPAATTASPTNGGGGGSSGDWTPYYTSTLTPLNWTDIRTEVVELVRRGFGPVLLRLAWHDAATANVAKGTGGPHATINVQRPADPGNNGLQRAVDALTPIGKDYPSLSAADLWSFAGCVAVKAMGGPNIKWHPGRRDYTDIKQANLTPQDNALPSAKFGPSELVAFFARFNMNVTDIGALILGGHGVGRCHKEFSGYNGPWTGAEHVFSNFYGITNPGPEGYKNKTVDLPDGSKSWQLNGKSLINGKSVMQLPSDTATLIAAGQDPLFGRMATDKDFFFQYWQDVFARLLELNLDKSKLGPAVSCDPTDF
ncbi:heme peroxidase [Zopfochytrium polystomum]|nr:heme peroxidase [Zopfochytrium polystomum]